MTIRELIEGLKKGKSVHNPSRWGKTAFYFIFDGKLLDEEGNTICNPADDIALYEYFNDISITDAIFKADKAEYHISENDIKLRDEVAKDTFFYLTSRKPRNSIEENARIAFEAANAFMKARAVQ